MKQVAEKKNGRSKTSSKTTVHRGFQIEFKLRIVHNDYTEYAAGWCDESYYRIKGSDRATSRMRFETLREARKHIDSFLTPSAKKRVATAKARLAKYKAEIKKLERVIEPASVVLSFSRWVKGNPTSYADAVAKAGYGKKRTSKND